MHRNKETGAYEHDFRVKGVPRYHMSYGVVKRADADRKHAVAVALFRSGEMTVIEALRKRRVTLEQLEQLYMRGRPFSESLLAALDPWPTFGDAVTLYVQALVQNVNRAAGTVATVSSELARATEFFGASTRLDAITSRRVTEYQASLMARGFAVNTVTAYVSRVGSLFRWMRKQELRDARDEKRPARTLDIPLDADEIGRKHTRRERFLSEPEATRLLEATPRLLLFPVAAGLLGGLRIDEMCHLRTAFDVDLSIGTIAVQPQPTWTPKTPRSRRHVPINATLRQILEIHIERFATTTWLTPAFRNPTHPLNAKSFGDHFTRIVTDADLVAGQRDPEGVTFHTLRHTFASWLLMRGTDIYTVANLLGNSVKQVEHTYGHLSKDHRAAAVERLTLITRLAA